MGSEFVHWLQALVIVLWLVTLVLFFPAIIRAWRGRGDTADLLVLGYPIIALTQILMALRWFAFPNTMLIMGQTELLYWSGLYVLSGVTTVLMAVIARAWWRR